MLIFADKVALLTAGIIGIISIFYAATIGAKYKDEALSIDEEIGTVEEPMANEKVELDKQYKAWKYVTIVVTIIALGIYAIPSIINL